ncbi:MAG: thioredoxin [Blastocatellia bacterium]
MEPNVQHLRCPACGAVNRVTEEALRWRLAPVCGRCKTPLSELAGPMTITDTNFAAQVLQSPLPVLLDLWAAWCGPCRMVAPVIDELAHELSGQARVGKLNVDENPVMAARLNARSIPTLLVFHHGQEVERMLGAQPKQEILRRLRPWIQA